MGNSAKRSARGIQRAARAKRAAELRIAGKTWREVGAELGCSASTALTMVEAYTADLPKETTETLRATLLARAEDAYRDMFAQRDKLKTPIARIAADDKLLRVLERHARIGRVIQEAAPQIVNVSQSQSSIDVTKLEPADLVTVHELVAKYSGQASPLAEPAAPADVPPRAVQDGEVVETEA